MTCLESETRNLFQILVDSTCRISGCISLTRTEFRPHQCSPYSFPFVWFEFLYVIWTAFKLPFDVLMIRFRSLRLVYVGSFHH